MERNISKMLAVNPGTRYLGFAVFWEAELKEWAIKVLRKGSGSERAKRMRGILNELISYYGVNTLVVKALHPARSSEMLNLMMSEFTKYGSERKIKVYKLNIDQVKKILFPNGKANKRVVMEEMANRYSELYPELERQAKCRNPYFVRSFEAVALGVAYLNDTGHISGKVEKRNST